MPRRRRPDRHESVAELVSVALLRSDLPDVTPAEVDLVRDHVSEALRAMPDVTRWGVTVTGTLVYAALSGLGARPYAWMSPESRARTAARLFRHRLPLLTEFGALTRGLALTAVVEARQPGAPRP